MTVRELIEELRQKEIELTFSGGKIKYTGPEENITPEIIRKLKENKASLIKFLWPEELSNLMPINPVGTKVPIFIVHGDNGNYIISEYLGPDQPVFGFFHPGSEGERIPYDHIKEMALSYIDKIKMVNPEGPYYLIGYSFGGNLAFEIAVRLQKAGFKVPVLVLIDSVCPVTKVQIKREEGFFRMVRKNILGPMRRWAKAYLKYFVCLSYIWRKKPIPLEKRNSYVRIKYSRLMRAYTPEKYNGKMLLFRATDNTFSYRSLGWVNLADDVKIIDLGGKHLDVFIGEEKITKIQTEIEARLNEVSNTLVSI